MEATKERQAKIAHTQHETDVEIARRNRKWAMIQVENDYQLGCQDAKETIYVQMKDREMQIRELIEKCQARGIDCKQHLEALNKIQIPKTRVQLHQERIDEAARKAEK